MMGFKCDPYDWVWGAKELLWKTRVELPSPRWCFTMFCVEDVNCVVGKNCKEDLWVVGEENQDAGWERK